MQFTCVCLNLWHGNLLPASIQFLKEQNADILLLQEVYHDPDPALAECYRILEKLTAELDYPHYNFAPVALEKLQVGKIQEGNLVMSRFPIASSDVHFFNNPYGESDPYDPSQYPARPRNLQHVVIDANGYELNVYNLQGVWDLDGDRYSEQRQNMSKVMVAQTKGKQHVILAGDTNAKPTNQAMRNLEAHLTNVFGKELKSTFNMRRKTNPGYATAAVDLMYVSPDITVVEKACPDVDVSDHLPLVVTLKVGTV